MVETAKLTQAFWICVDHFQSGYLIDDRTCRVDRPGTIRDLLNRLVCAFVLREPPSLDILAELARRIFDFSLA